MEQAIRKRAVVQQGGIVQVKDAGLPEGADVEVIVFLKGKTAEEDLPPLTSMIGAAKGVYGSREEIDQFIREIRGEWD